MVGPTYQDQGHWPIGSIDEGFYVCVLHPTNSLSHMEKLGIEPGTPRYKVGGLFITSLEVLKVLKALYGWPSWSCDQTLVTTP